MPPTAVWPDTAGSSHASKAATWAVWWLRDGTSSSRTADYFYPVGNFLDTASGLPRWSYLGEETTDAQRDFHDANKYMFYMSNHSDASPDFKEYVTPWVGDPTSSDKQRMDLGRWRLYDEYLRRVKDNGLLAYMSIFEDGKPGNYGDLPEPDRNRLLRYVMARTSAYSHLWYVLCFEWQEAWTRDEVNRAGTYLRAHNPWKRLVSVHDWSFEPWAFSDQGWATYIPRQGRRSRRWSWARQARGRWGGDSGRFFWLLPHAS